MYVSKILSACGLIALGMVLMSASTSRLVATDSRPRLVQEGAVIVSVDRNSAAINPLRYLVLDTDGPWIQVTLLKKKKQNRKGKPFWLKIDDIGAFIVE